MVFHTCRDAAIGVPFSTGKAEPRHVRSRHSPNPDGVRIGEQLKAVRLARRKTLAEVAEAAGLTKGFLSKIERDQASASVASLIRICETLGLSLGELFSATPGDVVRRSAYPPINFGGSGMSEYLLTPHGERRCRRSSARSSRAAAAATSPTACRPTWSSSSSCPADSR